MPAILPKSARPTNTERQYDLLTALKTRLGTTVGLKYLVALTGLALVGFVFAHMSGNLLVYKGRDALNAYAKFLQDKGPLLWVARGGLLATFLVHIGITLTLAVRNKQARPTPYAYERTVQASWASRHMVITGLVILAFVVFHLLHFTFGAVLATVPADAAANAGKNYRALMESLEHAAPADPKSHDVYSMVIWGFRNPWISLSYVVAQVFLGLHLSHGIASTFQTLGANHPRVGPYVRKLAGLLTAIVVIGNVSIPVTILLGFVGRDVK